MEQEEKKPHRGKQLFNDIMDRLREPWDPGAVNGCPFKDGNTIHFWFESERRYREGKVVKCYGDTTYDVKFGGLTLNLTHRQILTDWFVSRDRHGDMYILWSELLGLGD